MSTTLPSSSSAAANNWDPWAHAAWAARQMFGDQPPSTSTLPSMPTAMPMPSVTLPTTSATSSMDPWANYVSGNQGMTMDYVPGNQGMSMGKGKGRSSATRHNEQNAAAFMQILTDPAPLPMLPQGGASLMGPLMGSLSPQPVQQSVQQGSIWHSPTFMTPSPTSSTWTSTMLAPLASASTSSTFVSGAQSLASQGISSIGIVVGNGQGSTAQSPAYPVTANTPTTRTTITEQATAFQDLLQPRSQWWWTQQPAYQQLAPMTMTTPPTTMTARGILGQLDSIGRR